MVADSLTGFDILAAALQDHIGFVPQLFGYDRGYDFAGFILEHDPFLWWKEFLLFSEHVHDLDFIPDVVPFILWIWNHIGHGRVCDLIAVVIPIALVPKDLFNLLHWVFAGSIEFEQFADHGGFCFVYYQSAISFRIPEDTAVAEYDAWFDCLLVAEFYTRRQLAQLVLRNRRHDGQAQFRIFIECIDVVILKEHTHTIA